jgi:DNA-binding transcriptional LysR family regulator
MAGVPVVEMHQIRYFLALSETLNFTHAAERCNVTQPAMTRAIKCLEAELGGELFNRERALSHLTDLGEHMLPLMRQCYETALAAKTMAKAIHRGVSSSFLVVVSHTVELAAFTPMLRELSRFFPGLQLKLRRGTVNEITECLKSGEVELAIAGPLGETWSRLDIFPLFDEPLDLFVNRKHRLAGKKVAEFADLASETFVINSECEMAVELFDRLRTGNVGGTCVHQVATQSDLLTLLEADLGVAIIPISAARSDGFIRVRLNGLNIARKVSVYGVAGRRRGPCCTTMLNMLRAADWHCNAMTKQAEVAH